MLDLQFCWSLETAAWKFVERKQVNFAGYSTKELDEALRVSEGIVHAGEEYIFEGPPSAWSEGRASASSQQRFERGNLAHCGHQNSALFFCRGVERNGQIHAEFGNVW